MVGESVVYKFGYNGFLKAAGNVSFNAEFLLDDSLLGGRGAGG